MVWIDVCVQQSKSKCLGFNFSHCWKCIKEDGFTRRHQNMDIVLDNGFVDFSAGTTDNENRYENR